MNTLILKPDIGNIKKAAAILKRGGLVAFPTETVYGLGANALNPEAVLKVYEAKGRPSDNPMIVHIADISELKTLAVDIDRQAETLASHFWPGPLTMIFNKKETVPLTTTGGLNTIAVRMPKNDTALSLIREAAVPIAAPSANISGKPSPTSAKHVVTDLDGKIDVILTGGDCDVGIESTVIDLTSEGPAILRPGIITREDIEDCLGMKIKLPPSHPDSTSSLNDLPEPKSPGMKYKHYAPEAPMIIYRGRRVDIERAIEKKQSEFNGKIGIILFPEDEPEKAANMLFSKLRDFDEEGVDLILAGAVIEEGIGLAVMNRMLKSAGYNVKDV